LFEVLVLCVFFSRVKTREGSKGDIASLSFFCFSFTLSIAHLLLSNLAQTLESISSGLECGVKSK